MGLKFKLLEFEVWITIVHFIVHFNFSNLSMDVLFENIALNSNGLKNNVETIYINLKEMVQTPPKKNKNKGDVW